MACSVSMEDRMESIDEEIRSDSETVAQEDYKDANVEKKGKALKTYQRRHKSMHGQQLEK